MRTHTALRNKQALSDGWVGGGQDVPAIEFLLARRECPGTDSFIMGSVIGAFSLPSSLLSLSLSLSLSLLLPV